MKKWVDIGGIVLVGVLAGVGVWMMWGEGGEEGGGCRGRDARVPTVPAEEWEVRPAKEDNAATGKTGEAAPKAQKKKWGEMSDAEKLQSIRDKYGDDIPDNLKPVVYYLENPPGKTFNPARSRFDYFKHKSEREIAAVLALTPGTWMIGKPKFGKVFDADLEAALGEEIVLEESDTDEIRTMKTMVADTKKEFAEMLERGEKASDLMNATVAEFYELGRYRRQMEEAIGEIRRDPENTDEYVEDAVRAANTILAEKGLPPLKMPNILLRHASFQRRSIKAKENEQ